MSEPGHGRAGRDPYRAAVTPPVFWVPADRLSGSRVLLDGAEGRHAATVRRLRAGERVDLGDGAGRLARCVVAAVARDRVELDVLAVRTEPAPRPRLVVVQAVPKGDRGPLAVETMTEVGVDVIVPWAAQRCVVRWRGDRGETALERWRTTARQAGKQARRAWLPEVTPLAATREVARRVAAADLAVVLEPAGEPALGRLRVPDSGDVVIVVGPEGGVTGPEMAELTGAGAVPVRLGPTILRASTAGVVAAAVVLAGTPRWTGRPVVDADPGPAGG